MSLSCCKFHGSCEITLYKQHRIITNGKKSAYQQVRWLKSWQLKCYDIPGDQGDAVRTKPNYLSALVYLYMVEHIVLTLMNLTQATWLGVESSSEIQQPHTPPETTWKHQRCRCSVGNRGCGTISNTAKGLQGWWGRWLVLRPVQVVYLGSDHIPLRSKNSLRVSKRWKMWL